MATTLNMTLLLRRDDFTAEAKKSYVLQAGEPGYCTATKTFKVGDGSTTWENLAFANKSQIEALIKVVNDRLDENGDIAEAIKAAQADVDNLEKYVGEFTPTEGVETVVQYINKKTEGIATDANLAVLEGRISAIENAPYADETFATNAADQALTDAKAYVDEEDKFYNGIETVNALGGIAANKSLDGMTTHEILDMLLFPYVAFSINSSSRSAAAATLENGATQTLSSCSINVTKKSKPITSITLYNGSTVLETKTGDAVANGGTITFNGFDAITVSKSNNPNLKFTVTDGQTSTDRNVGASTFVYPYYWGVCAADATIDETLIEGLTKKVETKANKTVTFDLTNERIVFAYPKLSGYTELKSILDPNNFETIEGYTRHDLSITGLDGTTQPYYVYVAGAGTASGFKVQFKY